MGVGMTQSRPGKPVSLILGPLAASAMWYYLNAQGYESALVWTAAITTLTAIWWVFETLPIPATSLIPFAAFPLAGVTPHREVGTVLGDSVIILLMGGFILSKSLEKSGVHERFALMVIRAVGGAGGRRLVFAFMLAAGVLSMWISNTATTLMLLPIALAILAHSKDRRLQIALLLGTAYAASVGGIGTPIGTTPNVIFLGAYTDFTGEDYGFNRWMRTGVPVAIISIPIIGLWLTRGLGKGEPITLDPPGPWRSNEVRVVIVFALTILAWVTRGQPDVWGWSALFGISTAGDATVAVAAVIVMFLIPDGKGGRLLDWETANKIPWGVLLLFAGGLAIAAAFRTSGLAEVLGQQLTGLANWPVFLMMLVLALSVSFLTEVTSNTATTALLMPVLLSASLGAGINPELLMIPAAISASCAFMFPVATGPNAVIYSSEKLTIPQMAREGVMLNIIIAFVVAGVCYVTLQ